ncbi:Protein of unknown function [Bacillus mycoides]
MDGSG